MPRARNGLLFSLEQLPVQSGTRFPMVLNVVTRSVSGPLDIRGDHSDIMMALNCGWIILMARDPQAVYDMNILAVKIGEHPDVRLPVIVASDGFFTSHQKRRVKYFEDARVVQDFLGPLDIPITAARSRASGHNRAVYERSRPDQQQVSASPGDGGRRRCDPHVFEEYGRLSGRHYPVVDAYRMEDAEAALFIVNSAADTAKDAADRLRSRGHQGRGHQPERHPPVPGG